MAALLLRFRGCFKTEKSFGHRQRYLLGLMADLKRKSIEPIALAAGVAARTLQEFLAFFAWDHERVNVQLQQVVMDEHACETAIGVIDASAHPKQGDKTPGVQRQYRGETGKLENCVVGQHLLYTSNDPKNPFTAVPASDLYLPKEEGGGWHALPGGGDSRGRGMAMYFLADQTERLRGEKSADHPGAGGRGGQRPGVQDLEPVLALVC